MSSEQIPVWLDCDPGHDDAFAILLAAYHPNIKLLGISTVFGNATLENTTHNALSLLTAIGKDAEIPVHIGRSQALARPALHAPEIHGITGLDGTDLLPVPECTPSPVPAVDAMAAALKAQAPGTAFIVATGSLTNIGALFLEHPDLIPHVRGLSLMGGSFGRGFSNAQMGVVDGKERIGNYTPYAEFNILIDPEAAASIFDNDEIAKKTTVVPLDLSHQVLATPEVRGLLLHGKDGDRTGTGKSTLRIMLVELLYFFSKTYADIFGITAGPPLHDPLAVAAVLIGLPNEIPFYEWDAKKSQAPEHRERFKVTVDTEGTLEEAVAGKTTGQTIATALPPGSEGVCIPRSLDIPKFWEVIEECITRADETNEKLGK